MTRPDSALKVRRNAPGRERFLHDVITGLRGEAKSLPYKYLYDERGSELFERICEVPEYYLTRVEIAIMKDHLPGMAAALGPRCLVIEYGSGSGLKTRMLLGSLEDPVAYVPIDISLDALGASARRLNSEFPSVEVLPIHADYTSTIEIPRPARPSDRRIVFFPGSTIGNFLPSQAVDFMRRVVATTGPGGALLIGVDLKKDPAILEAAYDDAAGVTALFTTNLLHRINNELDGDLPVDRFAHVALYNPEAGRVEIYLEAREAVTARISDETVTFRRGERIHMEYSYKYDPEGFAALAAQAGLSVRKIWTDPRRLFSVQYLTVD